LCTSSIEDEGRSFEVGFQEQASNHFKRLPLRVVVVSVEEKRELKLMQVRIRKTNYPEPLFDASLGISDVENGIVATSHYKSTSHLIIV
jgi:hypothetical protein